MTDNINDSQRRVIGMVQALTDIDTRRVEATQAWASLQPTDEAEAKRMLDAAVTIILQVLSDQRLNGRQAEIDRLTRLSIAYETAHNR